MLGFTFSSGHAATAPSNVWSTPNPTSRLLSDFRSGLKSPQPLQRGPLDPAKDIHRMLENYSTDISRTGLPHRALCHIIGQLDKLYNCLISAITSYSFLR